MDINSSLLRYNMLRNEQSVKGDGEESKKVLDELEVSKKINDILSKVAEGTLTVAEATKELSTFGITPQKTYQNGNEVLNIAFQGKQYSAVVAKVKTQTKNYDSVKILDSYIKDRVITVAGKAVNNVINNSVNGSSNNNSNQDTTSYTKLNLQNKYGFTEGEIHSFFEKKVLLWKMNYEVINKKFPGAAIKNPKDLKEVIECGVNAFNYKGSTEDYINGLYTNSNLSEVQIKAYIDDFAKLLKKELREKYSDFYLDNVLNFVKNETLSNLNKALPVRQILTNFKKEVNQFLTQKDVPYYEITKGVGKNKRVVNFFESAISPQKLINNKDDILESGNNQAKFLVNLLYDTAEQLNLTKDERRLFFQRVFDAVAKKVGGYEKGDSNLNFSNLSSLDKNNDGSWMDEFCQIVEKEASKINPNVDRNPSKLLGSTLSNISAEDFLLRLDEFLLHDDGSVRKFAQMISEALDKFNCYNDEESENLIHFIFNLLNDSAGVEKTGKLHQDTIKNLNEQGNIFEKLEEIINSDRLNILYQVDVDEEIDTFKQGSTGDCWLLSALISLNASEKGKNVIKNAIQPQPNGDIIVNFAGVGVSYTITVEEIVEAREASKEIYGPWSDGDDDVLVFEIATEKLRRDIAAGKVKIDQGGVYDNFSNDDNGGAGEGITGGWSAQMIYFLTGQKSDLKSNIDGSDFSQKQIEKFFKKYEGEATSTTVLNFSVGPGRHTATTVTGEVVTVDISTGHAFSITDIDYYNKTVTIVNPWDSDKEYTLTWAEFAKFGIRSLSAADLSDVPV